MFSVGADGDQAAAITLIDEYQRQLSSKTMNRQGLWCAVCLSLFCMYCQFFNWNQQSCAVIASLCDEYDGKVYTVVQSYWHQLTKTAGKLQSRNNHLMKLAGSSWGANANTLWSSVLAVCFCYSVAEYCCPVWQRSIHVSLVDAQLHTSISMRLISGTVWSTPLPRTLLM